MRIVYPARFGRAAAEHRRRVARPAALGLDHASSDTWSVGAEWKRSDFGTTSGSGGNDPTTIDFRDVSDVAAVKLEVKS